MGNILCSIFHRIALNLGSCVVREITPRVFLDGSCTSHVTASTVIIEQCNSQTLDNASTVITEQCNSQTLSNASFDRSYKNDTLN